MPTASSRLAVSPTVTTTVSTRTASCRASGWPTSSPAAAEACRCRAPAAGRPPCRAAGGNTSLGGIVAASFVALGLIAFPGLLADIPLPALAAVVAAAAIGLVDVEALRDLWRVSRVELAVAVVTAASVVAFDVLVGVVLSVALSVTIALSRMTRPHDAVLGHAAHLDGWVDVAAYPDAVTEPGLVVYRFDAPLLFTNADRYCERVLDALERAPGDERWLVLDFEGIGSIDATAVAALRRLVDDVQRSGVEVIALARANHVTLDRLGRAELLQPEGSLLVVPTINAAVRGFRESGGTRPDEHHGTTPPTSTDERERHTHAIAANVGCGDDRARHHPHRSERHHAVVDGAGEATRDRAVRRHRRPVPTQAAARPVAPVPRRAA